MASIIIPTSEEAERIGWTEPAVHCTFFGKVFTSDEFLWELRNHDLSTGYELWIDWLALFLIIKKKSLGIRE